jgi:hypothetical protein
MLSFTVCCLYATLVFQNNQVVPKQSRWLINLMLCTNAR